MLITRALGVLKAKFEYFNIYHVYGHGHYGDQGGDSVSLFLRGAGDWRLGVN